ncbi:MAG: hypothetical protein ACO1SV_27120 [Fimbriimonas sp.]
MRAFLIALGLLAAAMAPAQAGGNLFATTRPDATIVVRKHATGTDVVEVTMQQAKYPEALLREQVQAVGRYLGNEPTGVRIGPYQVGSDPNLRFTQALFAVKGLIDQSTGMLRVEPFAKAFAGAPAPNTVDVLMVEFDNERPTGNTLQNYLPESGEVKVQAVAGPNSTGVEYRIQLLTQDPNKIFIPDNRKQSPAASTPPPPKPASGPDWVLYGVLGTAALAVGALVYSLLLRARPSRAGRA